MRRLLLLSVASLLHVGQVNAREQDRVPSALNRCKLRLGGRGSGSGRRRRRGGRANRSSSGRRGRGGWGASSSNTGSGRCGGRWARLLSSGPCSHPWALGSSSIVNCTCSGRALELRRDGVRRGVGPGVGSRVAVRVLRAVTLGRRRKRRRVGVRAILQHTQTVLSVLSRVEVVVLLLSANI